MGSVVEQHRAHAPRVVRVAVLTISDTRTAATDASGDRIIALCREAGHEVVDRALLPDDAAQVRAWVERARDAGAVDAAILTGGTGVSPRDVTIEALAPVLTKVLPGFGELFRMLSYAEIGSAALMSRAEGGLAGRLVVLALPGSKAGVELAMTKLVIPELPHLVGQACKS